MSIYGGPDIVTNGLVLCLDAANGKSYPGSGTVWSDLSGNNNNGTLTVGQTYSNIGQGIINYSGTQKVSTNLTIGSTYTMSIWFRLTSVATGSYQALLGVYQSNFMCLIANNSNAFMGVWTETSNGNALGSSAMLANIWYNYVLTRSGDSLSNGYKLYVNGKQTGTVNTQTRISTNFVYIGGRTDFSQTPSGGISIVQIYNRELSASEILQNYNALKGRFGL